MLWRHTQTQSQETVYVNIRNKFEILYISSLNIPNICQRARKPTGRESSLRKTFKLLANSLPYWEGRAFAQPT